MLFTEAGHDAVTVYDQRMNGAADPDLAAACFNEDRILVTSDLDFTDIRTYPPERYPGIIVFRPGRQSRDHLLGIARSLLDELTDSVRGQLWIVEDSRIRIRE